MRNYLFMKRSEALGLITEIISEVTYENLAEKRAEKILTALEKAGMTPPPYLFVDGDIGTKFVEEWEEE